MDNRSWTGALLWGIEIFIINIYIYIIFTIFYKTYVHVFFLHTIQSNQLSLDSLEKFPTTFENKILK